MVYQNLDAILRTSLRAIVSEYPIALAYLYGSQAAGQATLLSDVDIALVLADEDYDPKSRLTIELQIEEAIARMGGISNVDVRILNEAPIMVRGEVITNGKLLYSRDEEFRVHYETTTRAAYFDFMPIAAMHREAYFERIRERGEDGQS